MDEMDGNDFDIERIMIMGDMLALSPGCIDLAGDALHKNLGESWEGQRGQVFLFAVWSWKSWKVGLMIEAR